MEPTCDIKIRKKNLTGSIKQTRITYEIKQGQVADDIGEICWQDQKILLNTRILSYELEVSMIIIFVGFTPALL